MLCCSGCIQRNDGFLRMLKSCHIIEPKSVDNVICPHVIEGEALTDYVKYLADESRRSGRADALVFPSSDEEVCGAVLRANELGQRITVSAARTGITAGAVPDGGMLISLERMNHVLGLRRSGDGEFILRCQAGVLLVDVQRGVRDGNFADAVTWPEEDREALAELRRGHYFYPPDPTETSAAIGGTVACNASGAHTFLYGPTRPYVMRARVVLADGRVVELVRGQQQADAAGRFGVVAASGAPVLGRVPEYPWPRTKNSAGYYAAPGMDLIDLFIGSEGTLGIVTEVDLRIVPAPEMNCAVMTFWHSEDQALGFTEALRQHRTDLGIEAIEYFGPNALTMLRRRRQQLGSVSGVPKCLPDTAICGIYLDVGTAADVFAEKLTALSRLIAAADGSPDLAWAAVDKQERERLRVFRHALPETVNSTIAEIRRTHAKVTKLGTDMAVPDSCLREIIKLYRRRLEEHGLDYVIFGHIGDSHLHVNILPRNPEEYATGWELYHEFADVVIRMGGSPAAEHGIGKLKTDFLVQMYGADGIAQMKRVKDMFDPDHRLGIGTLFPPG